jgi:dTDP-4-dehydrorhamnose 3,5-epimerase
MDIRQLAIAGAFEISPKIHADDRGSFLEWFRADRFEEQTGHPFTLAQANCSVSAAGSIRGIHFAELPPSQAKYVTCLAGAILDVVIDIRIDSPTYGCWESASLDDVNRRAVYVSEGLAHAFMALADNTVVSYLCSAPYAPGREHGIHPFDETLGIEWPTAGRDGQPLKPLLSPKDEAAPSLEEVRAAGLLPSFEDAQAFVDGLAVSSSP